MKNQKLWVAGEVLTGDGWQILGIFCSEKAALACCELPSDFVAPLIVGEVLPRDENGWPGLYFPHRTDE